MYMIKGYN